MGTPKEYLPPALSEDAIQSLLSSVHLPPATRISPLQVSAAYHSIYLVHFPPSAADQLVPAKTREPDGSMLLFLRVAGRHLPRAKTLNEVGAMRWVRAHTAIPVPAVVRWDATEANPLGCEYTLLEKARGTSADAVYDALDDRAKESLVAQLADVLVQLHEHSWDHVGGLVVAEDGDSVVPGPMVDEWFWHVPDAAKYWGDGELVASLNPLGPYPGYTAWCRGQLEKYQYAILHHPSLEWMRDLLPRLSDFTAVLQQQTLALDKDVKIVLAHKDLHFANVMMDYDPSSGSLPVVTAILDWEFAGIVPAQRWNPVRAFLWNAKTAGDGGREEKARLWAVFERVAKEKGLTLLEDAEFSSPLQEAMQTAVNYIRAIVEVCPRGQAEDKVQEWRKVVEEAMEKFGI